MNQKRFAYLLVFIGVAMAIAAGVIWLGQPTAPAPRSPSDGRSQPTAKKPSESDIDNYTVAPDLPRYISIPAIKVPKTRVLTLGLANNDQIAVPDNIYDTGWYDGSAKPGQPGAMFIYGHVSSWQADGIFYNLRELKTGDTVNITRGDGKKFSYKVVSTRIYPYDHVDMHTVLAPVDPGTPGLNLMTCTGKVIKGTSEFNERLVVFTKQI